MIRALIVDDELHAREEMMVLLAETGAGVIEIVGSCGDGIEALKMIKKFKPEVLFLDIQMPVINGFELLSMINPEIMPHVVFVTAYDQYSLQAFEEKTLDYLLKPVDGERLAKTIAKLQQTVGENRRPVYESDAITRIPCLIGNRIKLVGLPEVEYVATGLSGVHVVTADREYYTDVTLKALEERSALLRCHKQFLINPDAIAEIVLKEGGLAMIQTTSGKTIPVSRRNLRVIKRKLLL